MKQKMLIKNLIIKNSSDAQSKYKIKFKLII